MLKQVNIFEKTRFVSAMVLFGWWFLRLISRLKLICCERKILYHGITVAAHVIGWSFCPMFLLFQVSFTIWFLLLACCLCYVFASWLAGHCQNCTAWLVPIMRTRSILEFLSLDKKLFKGVCLSFIFLGLLLVYFIVFVYIWYETQVHALAFAVRCKDLHSDIIQRYMLHWDSSCCWEIQKR